MEIYLWLLCGLYLVSIKIVSYIWLCITRSHQSHHSRPSPISTTCGLCIRQKIQIQIIRLPFIFLLKILCLLFFYYLFIFLLHIGEAKVLRSECNYLIKSWINSKLVSISCQLFLLTSPVSRLPFKICVFIKQPEYNYLYNKLYIKLNEYMILDISTDGYFICCFCLFEPIPKLEINFLFVLDMSANFRESKRFFVFTYKALLPFSRFEKRGSEPENYKCRWRDLNPRPADHESAVIPLDYIDVILAKFEQKR
jgi:hypothetical protein